MAHRHRQFFGLSLADQPLADQFEEIARDLAHRYGSFEPIPPGLRHLTLRYLGATPFSPQAVAEAAQVFFDRVPLPKAPLHLDRVETFGDGTHLSLTLAENAVPTEWREYAGEWQKALSQYSIDGATIYLFRPHVSLIRAASGHRFPRVNERLEKSPTISTEGRVPCLYRTTGLSEAPFEILHTLFNSHPR